MGDSELHNCNPLISNIIYLDLFLLHEYDIINNYYCIWTSNCKGINIFDGIGVGTGGGGGGGGGGGWGGYSPPNILGRGAEPPLFSSPVLLQYRFLNIYQA